jgi:hypothetical protein
MSLLRDPKRLIATLIAGVCGLLVLIDAAGRVSPVDALAGIIVAWAATLVALALLVGLLSVVGNHVMRVWRRNSDWGYSLILLLSMLAVVFAGTLFPLYTQAGELMFPGSLVEQPVRDLFRAFYQPLASSFLALLTFFSLSAALRAVRRRTADALVITIIALTVLVAGALPAGTAPLLNESVGWASDYLALAGARGLLIGAALGAVVAGVRVLFGFDQPFLDR